MSATQNAGVQDEGKSRSAQDSKERDDADAARARAEFEKATIKGFADLPDDHPMRRRMEMVEDIERINNAAAGVEPDEAAVAGAIAKAAGDTPAVEAFKDRPVDTPAKVVKPTEDAAQAAKQLAGEDGITVLDPADLAKYNVRVKIDGVEEVVPASKVLGTWQKGAAADVRLAAATKAKADAEKALDDAKKQAQQAVASAATSSATAVAQDKVATSEAAQVKFKEASDAMYSGDTEAAARLFAEAVAVASTPVVDTRKSVTPEDLVQQVTQGVEQQLSQKGALKQLFIDYPQIKDKKAFQIIADEYIGAFVANGDDIATAIGKAGDAIGEEYGFGKFAPKAVVPLDAGRPIKTGGPTTRAEKLSAKEELDVIQSGNARSSSTESEPLTVSQEIDAMRKTRPGYIA
jgi:hypothetical protein